MKPEVHQAVTYIKQQKPHFAPTIGLILGSGLSAIAKLLKEPLIIPYASLPHFPQCSVTGHQGQLHLGSLGGLDCVCLAGRVHLYEGVDAGSAINSFIYTLKELGCQYLIITSAAGSLDVSLQPGHWCVINDHLNLQNQNPLTSLVDQFSPLRFVDLINAYDNQLRNLCLATAAELSIPLRQGVYAGVLGPSFETPAEIRAFKTLGADLVGMSTVAEVIVARYYQLRVLGLSAITNLAAGLSDQQLSHQQTLANANQATATLTRLLPHFFRKIAKQKFA